MDIGLSVSRVGGKAQRAAYRGIVGDLKLGYAQFEELESFARFGARLNEATRQVIEHGRRIRECFKQKEASPVSVVGQITTLLALNARCFDAISLERMREAEIVVMKVADTMPNETRVRIESGQVLSAETVEAIVARVREALVPLRASVSEAPETVSVPNIGSRR